MDTDDRDHFQKIAAQAGPQNGLLRRQSAGSSDLVRDPAYCLRRTEMLFGCYRREEATNPDVYCSAVAAVLSEYQREVIDYVTDPRTGLPSTLKFLPTVAEVRTACDERAAFILRMTARPREIMPPKEIPIRPGEITYGEFLQRGGPRPLGAFDEGGYLGRRST